MTRLTRITRLESQVAELPPDGPAILARLQRMTDAEGEAAIKEMTDAELFAAVMAGVDQDELDVTKLTDRQLQRIADGESPADVLKGEAK